MVRRWLNLAGIVAVSLTTLSCRHDRPARAAAPESSVARLRVLTLNLMQMSPVAGREVRFRRIADFIRTQRDEGRPVDVLLLQEGCSGIWVGTRNSIDELRQKLPPTPASYDLYSRPCFGVPVFLTFEVGILSAAPFLHTSAAALPCHTGEWLDDCPLPGARRAVMVGIDHPMGRVNLFTVHLASSGRFRFKRCCCSPASPSCRL